MLKALVISLLFLFEISASYAQDNLSNLTVKKKQSASVPIEIFYSSLGFAAGFTAGGGFLLMEDDLAQRQPKGRIWPIATPFISSLGCHLEGSNYFKNPGGSYWGGVLGAFLGEIIGIIPVLAVSFNPESFSPFMFRVLYYCSYWIPTSLMTVWFYNMLGTEEITQSEPVNKLQLFPVLTTQFQGIGLSSRF